MRRFLGANVSGTSGNGNVSSAASTPTSNGPSTPTEPVATTMASATSATKNAFQKFGQQLVYSRSQRSQDGLNGNLSNNANESGNAEAASPTVNPPTPPSKSPLLQDDDADWDSVKLPFSNSSGASSSTGLSISTSGTSQSTSMATASGLVVSSAYSINASSLVDLKDEMMLELLSSDALLHVGSYEILGFDEVAELRREHVLLAGRLAMLSNKVAVECKIRDAALSISRLYTSKRMSRQADDQLETANRKVEAATNELNKIARREGEVRTKILRHMAAVLGLMLRKMETATSSSVNSPISAAMLSPLPPGSDKDLLSPRSVCSPTFSSSTSSVSRGVLKFEGPHLFAGNKDALIPAPRSPFTSPQLPSGMFSNLSVPPSLSSSSSSSHSPAMSSHSTVLPYTTASALESQIAELSDQLTDSQDKLRVHQITINRLQQEKDALAVRMQDMDEESVSSEQREAVVAQELQKAQELELRSRREREQRNGEEENWQRQIADLQAKHVGERTKLLEQLRNTLEAHADTHFGQFLPDPSDVELSSFLSSHLPEFLSQTSQEHERALHENELLSEQLNTHQETAIDASKKSLENLEASKRQIEIQQQEKSVLLKKISRIEAENVELNRSIVQLKDENQSQKASAEGQGDEAERRVQEAQDLFAHRLQAAERATAQKVQEAEQEKRSLRAILEDVQADLQQVRADKASIEGGLQSIWRRLPGEQAVQARLALQVDDDVSQYVTAFSTAKGANRSSFSIEHLVSRLEGVLASQDKILDKLLRQEDHTNAHRSGATQAKEELERSQADLQVHVRQVTELQQRSEGASQKELEMLEKLNDLQAALEQARSSTKRAESSVTDLQRRCSQLEQEKQASKGSQEDRIRCSKLEKELEEVREDLALAQDELDEIKSKESRQRVQLLEELSSLTEEASSLRTQLRTAQRKLAVAGRA